jgi:hypothetical protein
MDMTSAQLQPIEIPATTPWRYISFNRALNLRMPGEDTGDWHFQVSFFCSTEEPRKSATLAGKGMDVDTTPSLGELGVRDMAAVLERNKVCTDCGPVFAANHYRAIADLALAEVQEKRFPRRVTNRCINQWLDTPEQVETLLDHYLCPILSQLSGAELVLYNEWLSTIHYE